MLSRKFKRSLMAAIVAPAFAVPAAVLAEGQPHERQGAAQERPGQSQVQLKAQDMRASQIIGTQVQNRQGEDIGDIRDLVIDSRSGKVEYAALAHGGFLGMGEDLFAYPMSAFSSAQESDKLVLNASKERLEQAEGFNDDNWPKVRDDRDYWANLDERFGIDRDDASASAGATAQGERQFVRASELMDRQVQSASGGELGQVEDLIVNLEDGRVRFAVVNTNGEDKRVPTDKLDLSPAPGS